MLECAVMKIAIIGAQNTGKSTFIADLIATFPVYSTPKQTYRELVRAEHLPINQETSTESQKAIRDFLYAQLKDNTEEHVFFDRTVIDNFVYTALAVERGTVKKELLLETKKLMFESLSLLDRLFFIPTAVSIKLAPDQLRDIDTNFIDSANHRFIATLFEIARISPIAIDVIAGTREERVKVVKQIIQPS